MLCLSNIDSLDSILIESYLEHILLYFSNLFRTTEKPETEAFLVCSGDTCFDPAVIEDDQVPDLKVAASARLPDENLRQIFEQMTLRINQENKDSETDNNIRLLLEAAKVESSESVVKAEEDEADAVDEIEAEKLNEEDKSSPSTLFKPAAARPKLVLANREHSGSLNISKY